MIDKLTLGFLKVQTAVQNALQRPLRNENGQTEFVVIAILLGVILVIGGAFIAFGGNAKNAVTSTLGNVTNNL
ncbi:MAG: hypothetical protein ACYCRD_04885 [Leptospirillum sp.]